MPISDFEDDQTHFDPIVGERILGGNTAAVPSRPEGGGAGFTGAASRAWRTFREWRRTRPFWGGLLVVLSAVEILSTTVLSLGVTLRVGIGGIGSFVGTVIAVVLLICGLLLLFNPTQRIFYSIVAVVLAIATFNTINYGGFFIGMLLGIVGGALAFAWSPGQDTPGQDTAARRHNGGRRERARQRFAGIGALPGRLRSPGGQRRRMLSIATVALVLSGTALSAAHALPARAATSAPGAAAPRIAAPWAAAQPATVRAGKKCILGILFCPSPTPSPTGSGGGGGQPSPTPDPGQTPSPTVSPTIPGIPGPTPSGSPSPTGPAGHKHKKKSGHKHKKHRKDKHAPASPGLVVASVPFVLTAGTAKITNLTYHGVAHVPTATGGSVAMMKFTLDSVDLTGTPTLTIHENGSTAVTTTSRLTFNGNMQLYATKMSGDLQLGGLSVPVTLKPGNAESLLIQAAGKVTGLNITLTHVVTDQPLTLADASEWDNFHIRTR